MEYYVNLLGLRKKADVVAVSALESTGQEASAQNISNWIKDNLGPRCQHLTKKAKSARPQHLLNDEALVLHAITSAITSGKETALLTYDEDVFEQFYKTCWLLDTHYRGMLLADCYNRNPLDFAPTQVRKDVAGFVGDVTLLTKPSLQLRELLPEQWSPVSVHCVLIKNNFVTHLAFLAEREIERLFDTKAKTGGLNSEKLGGANCHVYLTNTLVQQVGNHAAIGFDERPASQPVAMIDVNLVLPDDEQFTKITSGGSLFA